MPLPMNIPPQFQSNEPPPAWAGQLPHVMSPGALAIQEAGAGGWTPEFRQRMLQDQQNLAADLGQQYPMGGGSMQPPPGNVGGNPNNPMLRMPGGPRGQRFGYGPGWGGGGGMPPIPGGPPGGGMPPNPMGPGLQPMPGGPPFGMPPPGGGLPRGIPPDPMGPGAQPNPFGMPPPSGGVPPNLQGYQQLPSGQFLPGGMPTPFGMPPPTGVGGLGGMPGGGMPGGGDMGGMDPRDAITAQLMRRDESY
jgi:hypothetical protein